MTGTEPLWLSGLLLAGKAILSQAIKDAAYHPVKRWIFQYQYSNQLRKLLIQTVDEYEKQFPISDDGKKFPFYHSQAVFEELSKVVLFRDSEINLLNAIRSNPNIIIPSKEELEKFYSTFIEKVQADNKLKSLFVNENYREEIFLISEKLKDVEAALERIEANTNAIPEMEKGIHKLNEDVQGIAQQVGFDPSIEFLEYSERQRGHEKIPFASNREPLIKTILSKKLDRNWIHIIGGILYGKTNLAIKLGEHLGTRIEYLPLDTNITDGYFSLLFKRLCLRLEIGDVSSMEDFQNDISRFSTEQLVIIFDDLPNLNRGESKALVGLFEILANGNIQVISIGYGNFSMHGVKNANCYNIETESFSQLEVLECLQKAECPDPEKWAEIIAVLAKGNPTIAHTLVVFLQNQSFDPTPDQLQDMVLGEYDGQLTSKVFEHLLRSIVDEQSRELLYRMNIPLSPLTEDTVSFVAGIDPGVLQPKAKLQILKGRWVQFVEDVYYLSPLIEHLRLTDLNRPTYLRINQELGYKILKNKKFSQTEAQQAILYFWRAEDYKLAGFVLMIVLRDSINNPDLFFKWGFEAFWYYSKLPSDMPIATRIVIRNFQVLLSKDNPKMHDYHLKDLKSLVENGEKNNIQLGHAYLTLAANSNIDEAQEYILKMVLDEEFFKTIRDGFSEVVPEGIIWAKTSITKESGTCDEWWELYDNLSPTQKPLMENSELALVGSIHLASGLFAYEEANQITNQDWESAYTKLEELEKEAADRNLSFIALNARKFQIKILIEKLNQSDLGVSSFKEGLEKYGNNNLNRFLLNDVIGRSLFLVGDSEPAFEYITEAIDLESGSDEINDFFIEKIDILLVASQLWGAKNPDTALLYSEQAVLLSMQSEFVGSLEVTQAVGELAIAQAIRKDFHKMIETLELGYKRLFQIPDRGERWKVLFIRYGHVFHYYSQIIQNDAPPEKDINGEEYEKPSRGYFLRPWSQAYTEFYFPQRRYFAVFQLVDYFEWIGDIEKAKLWGASLENISREFDFNPYLILNQKAIPYYLMDGKLSATIQLLTETIDFQTRASNGEDFSHLVNHPRLKETVIGYQSIATKPHPDDLIILVIIIPHIFQILNTSVGKPERCREKIGAFAEWLRDHSGILESQSFVECLINLCESFGKSGNDSQTIAKMPIPDEAPYNFYLQLISRILSAELADLRTALEIHFSFVFWIENNLKTLVRGSYAFIILPYFVEFWKNQFQKNRGEFPEPTFWIDKSQPYLEKHNWRDQLKSLFKVLQNHFELNISRDIDDWIHQD